MWLGKVMQGDKIYELALFPNEQLWLKLLEEKTYIRHVEEHMDELTFHSYETNFEDFPLYDEWNVNGHLIPLTRFQFEPGESIEFFAVELTDVGQEIYPNEYVEGTTVVDAYAYPNDQVKQVIQAREQFVEEAKEWANERGLVIKRYGIGSEDGEYLMLGDHFLVHLDPSTIEQRSTVKNFQEWYEKWGD